MGTPHVANARRTRGRIGKKSRSSARSRRSSDAGSIRTAPQGSLRRRSRSLSRILKWRHSSGNKRTNPVTHFESVHARSRVLSLPRSGAADDYLRCAGLLLTAIVRLGYSAPLAGPCATLQEAPVLRRSENGRWTTCQWEDLRSSKREIHLRKSMFFNFFRRILKSHDTTVFR